MENTKIEWAHHTANFWSAHAMCRVGKAAAGRLLDGVEWSQFPEVRP